MHFLQLKKTEGGTTSLRQRHLDCPRCEVLGVHAEYKLTVFHSSLTTPDLQVNLTTAVFRDTGMIFSVLLVLGICLVPAHSEPAEEPLSSSLLQSCFRDAKKLVDDAYKYSREESLRRVRRDRVSPHDTLRFLKQSRGDSRSAVRSADYMIQTLRLLNDRMPHVHKRSLNATDLLSEEHLNKLAEITGCEARITKPNCNIIPNLNKYRTITSICNNLEDPRRGSSNTPFTRWLPAQYDDGISQPKGFLNQTVNDFFLPLVRQVSNNILSTTDAGVVSDTEFTHMVTIFGQWNDHDLTFTPFSPSIRSFSNGVNCEESCERTEPCIPIPIPPNDPRFSPGPENCIPSFRSAPVCGTGFSAYNFGGEPKPREQLNELTAFLDNSQVYGSEDKLALSLREVNTSLGLLRVNGEFKDNGRELLPFHPLQVSMCATRARVTNDSNAREVPCFIAGDVRVDENIALTSLHTLFVREHNRLARALKRINPHWDSETLYQEARKIMGAYAQIFAFRDYLPRIIGPDAVEEIGRYHGYKKSVDPSIANVFATAAFRFAHLAIQPVLTRLDENFREHPQFPSVPLFQAFFTPWRIVFEGGIDPLLRGLITRPAKLNTQDHMMVDALRERLFQFVQHLALDLGALNMQRGRDHGLPGYNEWRGLCGLSQPSNEAELAQVLNNTDLARRLLQHYGTPANIDVWLGGVAEPFVPGGRVGPLFACLIGTQFQRIRDGDRLWYENPGFFTTRQRAALRAASLSRIICDNTDIQSVPRDVFIVSSRRNRAVNCRRIRSVNLSAWRERACLGMIFSVLLVLGICLVPGHSKPAEEPLGSSLLQSCFEEAKKLVDDAYTYSREESLRRVRRDRVSPHDALRFLKQSRGDSRSAVRSADYMIQTLRLLNARMPHVHKRSLNATDLLSEEDLNRLAEITGCEARVTKPNCNTTPNLNTYRTITSVCNNLQDPRRGSSNTPFTRWLPAQYDDGISQPKGFLNRTINGFFLPLVRQVSNNILSTTDAGVVSDREFTHMVTLFGQWNDHDLTFTPFSPSIRSFSNGVNCDESCERTEPCIPIPIPPNDPRLPSGPESCIPSFRSAPVCGTGFSAYNFGGEANPREQLNELTSFLDLSQVYGSEDKLALFLRNVSSELGLLRVNEEFKDNGRELLPFHPLQVSMCATRARVTNDTNAKEVPCFIAGDVRVDENIALTSIHTLFMREHNRLARALKRINPQWDGETLYQEARKIMGAYTQVFVFRDYLPHIIGPGGIRQIGRYSGYNQNVDPTIANVFATAAYRFAHLAVQPVLTRLDENLRESRQFPSVPLFQAFFAPWRIVFEGGIDPLLRGLITRPAKLNTQDHMMVDALRERLFQFVQHLALDLGSLNMQRARDHGLPGYNAWRGFCGLSQPSNQAELARVLNNSDLARRLLELYGTPANIDVWLGGVAEPFVQGGRVGPLFACLIATQFQRIRNGDRLWYENPGFFTTRQRAALRAASLSRIICDNTNIRSVPSDVFEVVSRRNRLVTCNRIRSVDLSAWRERTCFGGSCDLSREAEDADQLYQEEDYTDLDINESCFRDAKKLVDDAYTYSREESLRRVRRDRVSPHDTLRFLKQSRGDSRSAVRSADYMIQTLRLLNDRMPHVHKRSLNATDLLSAEDLNTLAEITGCEARITKPNCNIIPNLNKYRTATSVCNNLQDPRRGSSNTPFTRWLPAQYDDGISQPKGFLNQTLNGFFLPLVRQVSNNILSTTDAGVVSDREFTHMVTIFGQWNDHDLSFTPFSPSIRSFSNGVNCDESCDRTEPCIPIPIPPNDPRFSPGPETCIPSFRSAPVCGTGFSAYNFGGEPKPREQLNELTSFLDLGQVYGSEEKLALSLRDLTTPLGLLRVNEEFQDNGRELLPFHPLQVSMCATRARVTNDSNAREVPCFIAGDVRVDENIALTSLHTLFLREHNRLARALKRINPHWDGETLYQEARKIMGAYTQVFVLRDYLPHIIGPDAIRQIGRYSGYNQSVDPTIANVFATAAYRFAHLAIQPVLSRLDEKFREHPQFPSVPLYEAFFTPWRIVFEGGIDPLLRGLITRPAKLNTQDHMMVDALRERLFQFVQHLALDLGALNMQRARDHGLPGYNAWRGFCGLSQPSNEAELAEVLNNPDLARRLLELYGTPANIEVWLAGVAEPFVPGGRVGPLLACLIGTQFQRIRDGDRLWYENPGFFTTGQRAALRDASLSKIICDNTDIQAVPSNVFEALSRSNRLLRCRSIRGVDLSAWRERPCFGGSCGQSREAEDADLLFQEVDYADLDNNEIETQ
ncbi:uncharacterized protein V6R79_009692 [Siganus canaliculatus]